MCAARPIETFPSIVISVYFHRSRWNSGAKITFHFTSLFPAAQIHTEFSTAAAAAMIFARSKEISVCEGGKNGRSDVNVFTKTKFFLFHSFTSFAFESARGLLLPAHRFLDAARADSPAIFMCVALFTSRSGNNKITYFMYAIGMCLDVRRERKKFGECCVRTFFSIITSLRLGDGCRLLHMDFTVEFSGRLNDLWTDFLCFLQTKRMFVNWSSISAGQSEQETENLFGLCE